MTNLSEKLRLSDRFAEICRPVSAQYAKGEIDRHTAVDRMEEKRTFLDIDPNIAGAIIKSQLDGADIERTLRAKKKPNGHDPQPRIRASVIDMADLIAKNFPPMKWILPGWIPEGCTVIAGKPKFGKSLLCMALCHAIITDGEFLGKRCQKRDILILALEDNERRKNEQGNKLSSSWPRGVRLCFAIENIDNGGLQDLERLIAEHPNTGLVIVDCLVNVQGQRRQTETTYQHDYRTVAAFRELSNRLAVSIIIIHHTRKADAPHDVFDSVLGSTGLTGAADTIVVCTYSEQDGRRLTVRGRDVEQIDYTVDADLDLNIWTLGDEYERDNGQSRSTKQQILGYLQSEKYPVAPKDLAKAIGIKVATARTQLSRLARAGIIKKTTHGSYTY